MIRVIPDKGIRRDAGAVRNPTVVQQYVAQCSFEAMAFGLSKISENFLDVMASLRVLSLASSHSIARQWRAVRGMSWWILIFLDSSMPIKTITCDGAPSLTW
jgi:hypothetical protein